MFQINNNPNICRFVFDNNNVSDNHINHSLPVLKVAEQRNSLRDTTQNILIRTNSEKFISRMEMVRIWDLLIKCPQRKRPLWLSLRFWIQNFNINKEIRIRTIHNGSASHKTRISEYLKPLLHFYYTIANL